MKLYYTLIYDIEDEQDLVRFFKTFFFSNQQSIDTAKKLFKKKIIKTSVMKMELK